MKRGCCGAGYKGERRGCRAPQLRQFSSWTLTNKRHSGHCHLSLRCSSARARNTESCSILEASVELNYYEMEWCLLVLLICKGFIICMFGYSCKAEKRPLCFAQDRATQVSFTSGRIRVHIYLAYFMANSLSIKRYERSTMGIPFSFERREEREGSANEVPLRLRDP
jgi:hypothetical protein